MFTFQSFCECLRFEMPKFTFAGVFENCVNTFSGLLDNNLINIDELPAKALGQRRPKCGFAGAHETGQNHVCFAGIGGNFQ